MPEIKKLELDAPETKSADVVAENIDALRSLFPDAFSEGKVDFEVLQQLLGGAIDNRDEKYGLNWHGKRKARQIALTPSAGTLLPCPEDSVDWETTQNLMIEGDNLEVLKLFQKSYAGKVKLIYIDPPYNTGKDFVYPDDYRDAMQNYLGITGQTVSGAKISSNSEANGRFHTEWLNLMYPRLHLARSLLSKDGIIIVSIDDTEFSNLRLMMDSVFGAENFEASLIWEGGRKNDSRRISVGHDYALIYARDASTLQDLEIRWREKKAGLSEIYAKAQELREKYKSDYASASKELQQWYAGLPDGSPAKEHAHYRMIDGDGLWYPDNISSPNPRPNLTFEWKGFQPPANGWRYDRTAMARLDEKNLLIYPDSKEKRIQYKRYLHHTETWSPSSVFYKDRRAASKALKTLMDEEVFDFPKDIEVLARFVGTMTSGADVVLDFFAGSGSTAHAVMAQNTQDGGNRRFILVQLPEPLEPSNKEQKSAAEYCDKIGRPRNIAELTKERLRRSGDAIKNERADSIGDTGFRCFKLAPSNIRAWEPEPSNLEGTLLANVEHLVQGRTEQDVLYELLLKLGLDLCVPIEKKQISGKRVHSIGGGALIVCLADGLTKNAVEEIANGIVAWRKTLAPAVDTRVVFKDSGFADDVAKTNMAAILNQNGILDVRSL